MSLGEDRGVVECMCGILGRQDSDFEMRVRASAFSTVKSSLVSFAFEVASKLSCLRMRLAVYLWCVLNLCVLLDSA